MHADFAVAVVERTVVAYFDLLECRGQSKMSSGVLNDLEQASKEYLAHMIAVEVEEEAAHNISLNQKVSFGALHKEVGHFEHAKRVGTVLDLSSLTKKDVHHSELGKYSLQRDVENVEVASDPSLQIFFAYIFEFIALVLFE